MTVKSFNGKSLYGTTSLAGGFRYTTKKERIYSRSFLIIYLFLIASIGFLEAIFFTGRKEAIMATAMLIRISTIN